jgi:hypothetical protein
MKQQFANPTVGIRRHSKTAASMSLCSSHRNAYDGVRSRIEIEETATPEPVVAAVDLYHEREPYLEISKDHVRTVIFFSIEMPAAQVEKLSSLGNVGNRHVFKDGIRCVAIVVHDCCGRAVG